MSAWTMRRALTFIRHLALAAREVHYEVGLTGSVLKFGRSPKDLDIIIYPRGNCERDHDRLCKVLRDKGGMERVMDRKELTANWRKHGSQDTKHVEVWRYKGKRVDIMFLS